MKLSNAQRQRLRAKHWRYYPHLQRWVKVWVGRETPLETETTSVYFLDRNQYVPVPSWTLLAKDIQDFYQNE